MKLFTIAALLALPLAAPLAAHPGGHGAHAAHAEQTARLNLDTPVETIMADEKGKAVLEANLPGIGSHEHYEAFKGMGLRQIHAYAPEQLPAETLAKIETELSAIS